MEFQKLSFDDLEFLYVVRKQSAEFLHDPTIFSYQDVVEWFYKNVNDPNFKWWVIFLDSIRVGYIRTSTDELGRFFIGMDLHEKFRGKGISQRAYKEFINYLYQNTNLTELWLKVLKTNTRAIHIYEKLGFEMVESEIIDRANLKVESITYKLKKDQWYDIQ